MTIKSSLDKLAQHIGNKSVAFEVTQRCNQDCVFCYNVWKCGSYPVGELETTRARELLDCIIRGYAPDVITFTGGEPLLRGDLVELVRHASRRARCILITNGVLMDDQTAKDLAEAELHAFQFTLLSADRKTHNALVCRDSFDQLIEGIASAKATGCVVTTIFVATRANIAGWSETLELNAALGVNAILFNRFNIGGAGVESAKELMPSADELRNALEIADEGSRKYGIAISTGVPVPRCVIDTASYKNLHFPDCPVGTRKGYPAIDPLGNVRPCNHSPTILGNLFDDGFAELLRGHKARTYSHDIPEVCRPCKHVADCRGGCRAAAEVCGDRSTIDPFVSLCIRSGGDRVCAG